MDVVKKRDGRIGLVTQTTSSSHSALFGATFANGSVETDVMVDQGVDPNFIAEDLIAQLIRNAPSAKIVRLKIEQIYCRLTGEPCLTCRKKVALHVYLK